MSVIFINIAQRIPHVALLHGRWSMQYVSYNALGSITNFKKGSILDDDVVHMEGLEVIKVRRERDEVSRVLGAVELHEVRSEEWVGLVASPSEFSESLLEFGVRADDLVGREKYQDSGSSTGGSGCTRIGRLFLLEGFAGRVPDQPSDAVFVEYPHAGHCERDAERKKQWGRWSYGVVMW